MTDTPPKKPSGAENDPWYLEDQVSGLIHEVDLEQDRDKRWELLKRLRDRTSALMRNRSAGNSPWIPLGFAVIVSAIFAIVFYLHRPTSYVYSAPDNYFRVVEKVDDYAFVMQRVERGVPQVSGVKHFCKDYQPQFEAGMTLAWFAYDDRGSCQSLASSGRGYVIVRDSAKCPVLPTNCRHTNCADWQHDQIVCDGKPNFN